MKRVVLVFGGIILVIVIAILLMAAYQSRQVRIEAEASARVVESLVHVGMHEDEVVAALRNANRRFTEKVKPTIDEYYHIYVPLTDSVGTLSTIEYTLTGGGEYFSYRAYVVITLDRDYIVISVD